MSAGQPRIAALWFPDWPIQAAQIEDSSLTGPIILVRNHHVEVCNRAARAAGVKRGMRLRQAQAICSEATVVEANEDRDGALFTAIATSLDDVASSVEVLRPGLVIVDAGAASRFHGESAVEMLIDSVARRGVDSTAGVADEIATAIIAARDQEAGHVVARGASKDFLAVQPVSVLSAETALGVPSELVQQFQQLGLRRLGDVAKLPLRQVVNRFGPPGARVHDIVTTRADRRVAPEEARSDLSVAVIPADPIARVDSAAFAARQLAAKLHEKLAAAGVVCLRLKIRAEFNRGQALERVWRTREALSEDATADRVRWQLDGWLTAVRAADSGTADGHLADDAESEGAGIIELSLEPLEVGQPDFIGQLWGSGSSDEHVKRAIARVQSTLGTDKVLQPWAAGGRGVAERVDFVPYGDDIPKTQEGSWPGRIPAPLPARRDGGPQHPAARIRLIDATAKDVQVTAEAVLSSVPYAVGWGKHRYMVVGWAGPWPVDTLWWQPAHAEDPDKPRRVARLQLVGKADNESYERAWLLQWVAGQWRVEATYS
ncbi:MAG: Y-family DNA polymerase [Corynebacterium casei]|uniref:DNA polymerase involved in DNA repair n=1 Tax=Corynebacterium casei LMG S-19264 TaxID=1285583 RepID=A0ABN4CA14_9CORY|nr:DNA polymerase Y family protein [Corynebacterium casei]AHI19226.1 DNA polymerase involved in DNA repair [Corynebacterium casei LMG S-19264]SLM87813.1 DNA polymerase-like protein PA0670 [Corynebacterium casei]HCJ70074.1 DNA polymerase Y family protein [Corynebacterium casei]